MKRALRNNFLILSFALVIVMLGFGMVIPIFPFYIEQLGAGGLELGMLVAMSSLLELVFGPLWGSLSDRIGRKPVLAVGMAGYALSSFLMGLSTELWMLFASRALSGILSSAAITSALAYVSDSTTEKARGQGMGRLGAAMALGMILGPAFGGYLAAGSLSRPFFLAAGLAVVSFLLVVLLLPESLAASGSASGRRTKLLSLSTLREIMVSPTGVLLIMVTMFSFALTNFESVFGLYALEKFNFGPEKVGSILMVVAGVSTVGKAALTGPATTWWGERRVIQGSLLAGSVGFLALLWAGTFPTILLATGFFILSKTLLRPAALALISKQAQPGKGMLLGLSNSFMSLGRIFGPLWAGFVFDINVNYPYLSGSILMLAGFLVSLSWLHEGSPR